jgi:predicted heme/steroid binding protein
MVLNAGNLGIGTSTPGTKLEVNDGIIKSNVTSTTSVGTGSHFTIENPSTGSGQSTFGWTFGGAAKASMRVDYSGNMIFSATAYNYYFNQDVGTTTTSFNFTTQAGAFQTMVGQFVTFPGRVAVTGNVTTGSSYTRSASGAGYLDGRYGDAENTNTSGAIYSIGTGSGGTYVPGTTTLGNMYGVGYTQGTAAGLGGGAWGFYVASGGTARHFLDSDAGHLTSIGNHKATIYYDYNDTSYYVDPASSLSAVIAGNVAIGLTSTTSRLQVRRISGVTSVPELRVDEGTQWYQINSNTAVGSYNTLVQAGDHSIIYSNGTTDTGALVIGPWSAVGKGLRIEAGGNVGIGVAASAKLDVNGADVMPLRVRTTDAGPWAMQLYRTDLGDGPRVYASDVNTWSFNHTVAAGSSVRSPIFYDADNTGYYINGASTSNLYGLTVNQTITGSITGSSGSSGYSSPIYAGGAAGVKTGRAVWASGMYTYQTYSDANAATTYAAALGFGAGTSGSAEIMANWVNAPTPNGLWYRTLRDTIDNWSNWLKILDASNYSSYAMPVGSAATNNTSVAAPIFYDSDNTGYYANPAGTSILNAITLAGSLYFNNNLALHWKDGGGTNRRVGLVSAANTAYFGDIDNSMVGGSAIIAANTTIAGYVNATQRSTLTAGAFTIYPNTSGVATGLYVNGGDVTAARSSTTGVIYFGTSGSRYLHYDGTVYYLAGASLSIDGAAYATKYYDASDSNYYCDPAGTSIFSVLNLTSANPLPTAGGSSPTNGMWRVTPNIHWNAAAGYSFIVNWDNGSSGANQQFRVGNGGGADAFYVTAAGSTYAPIFYDLNDSGYYCDPNSVSNLYNVNTHELGVQQVDGAGRGLSLYGGYASGQPTFGMMFAVTSTYGTYGQVSADWATYFTMDGTANRGWIFRDTAYGNKASISNGGYMSLAGGLGVGTSSSSTAGEIRATNNITAYYSDMRLKKYLGAILNPLDKLMKLSGFYYTGNELAGSLGYNTEKPEVGVSAQEVLEVLPEIVKPAPIDDKYYTLDYARLVPLLIEAIKELKLEVDELKRNK